MAKTTLSVNMGVELAMLGVTTAIIDCDINHHSSIFGREFLKKNHDVPISFIDSVDTANVISKIKEAEASNDVVIVDLPAGTTELSLRALTRSQLVVIPAQKTAFDVRDATRTALQIKDAEEVANVRINSVLVWSRVAARKETRTERTVRQLFLDMITDPERSVLKAPLLEYDAFSAGFVYGWVPRQVAEHAGKPLPDDQSGIIIPGSAAKATENIAALTGEVFNILTSLSEGGPAVQVRLKPDYQEMLERLEKIGDGTPAAA